MKEAMKRYDPSNSGTTGGLDYIQKHFDCCGIQNASDWRKEAQKATVWIQAHINDVPDTCCIRLPRQRNPTEGCGIGNGEGNSEGINNEGCYSTLILWINSMGTLMGCAGIIFVMFEVLCVVIGCMMIRTVNENIGHTNL